MGFGQFIPILMIFVLGYFLLIRPQNQEREAHEALLASLTKGDWIVTQGGMYGVIAKVDTETVVLEIADKTKITLEKKFVSRRIEPGTAS